MPLAGTTSPGPTGLPSVPPAKPAGVPPVSPGRTPAEPETSVPPNASPSRRSRDASFEPAGRTVTAELRPGVSEVMVRTLPACDAVALSPAFGSALSLSSVTICAGVREIVPAPAVWAGNSATSTGGP